ncbi:MFS transporter [Alicyclobacillus sp. SO9]|uniref:MFS transporter n=1 Tax=Alicyclobacillus sp. SO9 TaxID=2665646 RepID=UPI0018E7E5A3|nr:MFS transporter [Alicyclobacillus sp. SO9]QQE77155.1 MFS transporter [Alicyclobacillus sp. SO9]
MKTNKTKLSFSRFLLLLSLGLVEFVRGGFFIALYPLYATNVLKLSVAWVGVILSSHYLAETLCKPLAGVILDRYPRRNVLGFALALGLLGLLATVSVKYPLLGLIGAIIWGAGASPIWLAVLGAGKEDGERQGRWMSRAYTFWLIGIGLSMLLVNVLMQNYLWLVLTMLVGVWILATIAVTGTGRRTMAGASRKKQVWAKEMASFLRRQWSVFGGVLLQTMAASMLIPILPLFARKILGLSNIQYTIALAGGGGFAVLVMLLTGRVVDRAGPRRSLVLGFLLCGSGVALLGNHPPSSIVLMLLILTVLSMGYGLVLPAWNTFVATIIPSGRQASAWGLYTTAEGVGVSVGPAFGGVISDAYGLPAAFLVSGIVLALLGVFYALRFYFQVQS